MENILTNSIKIENLYHKDDENDIKPTIYFIEEEASDPFQEKNLQSSDSCVKETIFNGEDPVYLITAEITPKIENETISNIKCAKKGTPSIKCEFCTATFKKEQYYKAHLRTHSNAEKIECNMCHKSFQYNRFLKHIMVHTGERPHSCEICGRAFRLRRDLKQHSFTHTGEKPYTCTWCGKQFADASARRKHYQTHTGKKPYKCELCSKSFTQISHVREHQVTHTKEKLHMCNICGKNFTTKSSMHRHILTHTNRCSVCGESFTTHERLERHKDMHSMERPFSCPHCSKRFLSKTDANDHLLIHSDEKNFFCALCDGSFKSVRYLRVHHYNYHKGMELPFVCKVCSKGFFLETGLKRHAVVHAPNRRVRCPACSRRFSSFECMEKHTCEVNAAYYNCEICKRKYRHKYDLTKHIRKYHLKNIKIEKLD